MVYEQKDINYGQWGMGDNGPRERPHWSSRGLNSAIEADIKAGNIRQPFDFVYNMFLQMLEHTPRALKDLGRFYRPDSDPNPYYQNSSRKRQIELVASFSPYDQNPTARHMAMCALADSRTSDSQSLLSQALYHFTNFMYLGEDYKYQPPSPISMDNFSIDLPFHSQVIALWNFAEQGKHTEALNALIPLVNLLAEREVHGVFPIGIGAGGSDMSERRYHTNMPDIGAITFTAPDIRNAILLAVDANESRFYDERARTYAKNMLASMADQECRETADYLPGDLHWLMVCYDRMEKGLPLQKRNEEYADVPLNFRPVDKVIKAPQELPKAWKEGDEPIALEMS